MCRKGFLFEILSVFCRGILHGCVLGLIHSHTACRFYDQLLAVLGRKRLLPNLFTYRLLSPCEVGLQVVHWFLVRLCEDEIGYPVLSDCCCGSDYCGLWFSQVWGAMFEPVDVHQVVPLVGSCAKPGLKTCVCDISHEILLGA